MLHMAKFVVFVVFYDFP